MAEPTPTTQRIANVTLDERTVVRRSADIEHERRVAIFDLLEDNSFAPDGLNAGPYHLHLAIEDNRLAMQINDTDDQPLERSRPNLFHRPGHAGGGLAGAQHHRAALGPGRQMGGQADRWIGRRHRRPEQPAQQGAWMVGHDDCPPAQEPLDGATQNLLGRDVPLPQGRAIRHLYLNPHRMGNTLKYTDPRHHQAYDGDA